MEISDRMPGRTEEQKREPDVQETEAALWQEGESWERTAQAGYED